MFSIGFVLCSKDKSWKLRQGELLVDGRCSWPASHERPDKEHHNPF